MALVISFDGVGRNQPRDGLWQQPLKCPGELALIMQGHEEDEQGFDLPLGPAEFFSKQTQRKMREVQKLSGACRHVQSVEWQQVVRVSLLVLRRGFTPVGKVRFSHSEPFSWRI